ncbi:tetratricopeptide repeat protein [Thermogemmatispora sp.]|uniref:tetratricopeptide repeat protein n=1 Tax=Thermogemmatispora sp. TaxID=1968838 RepID=UPI0035E3FD29
MVTARPLQGEQVGRLLAGEPGAEGEEPLEFGVPKRALRLDYVPLPLEEGGGLASPRLQGVLADYQVGHRVYPVRLRQEGTGRALSTEYALVVLPRERAEEVIDWKRTECRTWIGGRPYIRTLGIKESWTAQGRLLVGLVRKYCSGLHSGVERVLVQERLRRAMEEAELRGLAWTPLSACHDPDSGVRVERLRAYLRGHPEDAEAWRELGWVYRALLQHEAGLEAIERALRLRPDEAESWECRGRLLEELGEQEEALESYRRTVELGGRISYVGGGIRSAMRGCCARGGERRRRCGCWRRG